MPVRHRSHQPCEDGVGWRDGQECPSYARGLSDRSISPADRSNCPRLTVSNPAAAAASNNSVLTCGPNANSFKPSGAVSAIKPGAVPGWFISRTTAVHNLLPSCSSVAAESKITLTPTCAAAPVILLPKNRSLQMSSTNGSDVVFTNRVPSDENARSSRCR